MRPILVGQQDLDGFLIKEKTSTRMNRRKCLSACLQPERSGAVLKVPNSSQFEQKIFEFCLNLAVRITATEDLVVSAGGCYSH